MLNPRAKIILDEFPRDYQKIEDKINEAVEELESKNYAIKSIDRKEDYTVIVYEK